MFIKYFRQGIVLNETGRDKLEGIKDRSEDMNLSDIKKLVGTEFDLRGQLLTRFFNHYFLSFE